ncbi:uncharacterized protein LOC134675057 isoform X1 [Cydia fagiglandana]|uniref:uncharacterized protein LOC134647333 isoform X1 n=1 Tax=Cydia amplana TaxID=1869771 RepID=UPI002FE64368
MAFTCGYCGENFSTVISYNNHQKSHRFCKNVKFPCVDPLCKSVFNNYESFRNHNFRLHQPGTSTDSPRVDINSTYSKCTECNQRILLKNVEYHSRTHDIQSGKAVTCPYNLSSETTSCGSSTFTSIPSLKSHVYRNHFNSVSNLTDQDFLNPSSLDHVQPTTSDIQDCNMSDDLEVNTDLNNETDLLFLKPLLLLLLKLEARNFLSQDAICSVVEGYSDVHENSLKNIKIKCLHALETYPDSKEAMEKHVFNSTYEDSMNGSWSKKLTSKYLRFKLYSELCNIVLPISIMLGRNNFNKMCSLQYIPIIDTIRTWFADKTFLEQFQNPKNKVNDVLKDITCGSKMCNNEFINNPNTLKIILYQDAFEVCNPLGSSKIKHKILGVYMTLVNVFPYNRSKIDNMKLVLLCKEKHLKEFGHDKIFGKLTEDLRSLETRGVYIKECNQIIYGTLLTIIGDNLGSHTIGGFVENFNVKYFCRFCLIEKEPFAQNPILLGKKRTIEDYNEDVKISNQLHEDGSSSVHNRGVKQDSVFNQIENYHVIDGLPPCLGHDLFEGVVQFDIALAINYFINNKSFTPNFLNMKMERLSKMEKKSVPPPFKAGSVKIGGQALENWHFLNYLPLILLNSVNIHDPVWQMIIKLREIAQLICAYEISIGQTALLSSGTKEYLILRKQLFPNTPLRPKHHYLLHYGELTRIHGPLIYSWTLRFESKHRFFKNVVRHLPNFVNITLSLSNRHQLHEGYLSQGIRYDTKLFSKHSRVHRIDELPSSVRCLISNTTPGTILSASQIGYRGINYATGDYLLYKHEENVLNFLEVEMILFSDTYENPYFIGCNHKFQYNSEIGLCQKLFTPQSDLNEKKICSDYQSLLHFNTYKTHIIDNCHFICLHHAYLDLL